MTTERWRWQRVQALLMSGGALLAGRVLWARGLAGLPSALAVLFVAVALAHGLALCLGAAGRRGLIGALLWTVAAAAAVLRAALG